MSPNAFAAITTDARSLFASRSAPPRRTRLPAHPRLPPSRTQPVRRPARPGPHPHPTGHPAALEFDTAALTGTSISALAIGYNAGKLTLAAPPWLASIALPPDSGTIKTVLNDALPRLLFSSTAGAIIEALTGPGFLVGPLDSFFSNTGSSASHPPLSATAAVALTD